LVLNCVRTAEQRIVNDHSLNKEYLPQRGDVAFTEHCKKLMFGEDADTSKVATVQTLSGTGALRLASEFIKRYAPGRTVYLSNPTWGTHNSILAHADVAAGSYRYWDAESRGLDIEGMLEDIQNAPDGSAIMLHAAAHNPTGVDPTREQWGQILEVCLAKNHIVWFDCAYQGYATGDLEADAFAIRSFTAAGANILVSQSFAKNIGLYGERVGALNIVCSNSESVANVTSQLDVIIRNLYSSPPKHGASIVKTIMDDPALYAEWKGELADMSNRILDMRSALFDELTALGTPGSWTHIKSQIGMFSFTGLTVAQSEAMVDKHHIYMLKNGRISMAGVTTKNVKYIAAAIDDVVRNH